MRIAVGSAHRNSAGNVPRYMRQIRALADRLSPHHSVRVIAVEGDSTDATRAALIRSARDCQLNLDLVTCNHGGPVYGSTEHPARMAALSRVGNAIFDAVNPEDDLLLYVESDLIWDPTVAVSLLDHARFRIDDIDVVAPLIMAGDLFYDVWAYRDLHGNRFSPFRPFHHSLSHLHLMEVASVGSCLAMRGSVARECRIRDEGALIGWCADARSHGYTIGVDANLTVRHPA